MRSRKFPPGFTALALVALTVFGTPARAVAQQETILYNFVQNIGDTPPYNLYGGLVFDAAGNLYGTTAQGCLRDGGAVFELSPQAGGNWAETALFCFPEGSFSVAGLILDKAGNLYGTTSAGGAATHGSVFQLAP